MVIAGLKQGTVWADIVVVGGSSPLQTAGAVIRLDGSGTNSIFQADTLIADTTLSGTRLDVGAISGTTANLTQIITPGSANILSQYATPGSPYFQGDVARFTAETIITGGMWVTISGAAGGASVLARAAAASTTPLGVAIATAGSNATVSILTRGFTYLTAEATISNATQIRMGAGAALNTVIAADAGTGARGVALAGAGSEGVALVYLW